jgi:fatty acid desaturase
MEAEFIPAGIDRSRLKALPARSDRAGLVRLAAHAGTLVATGMLVLLARGQPLLLFLAMALHGAVLVFLFAPLHETIHRTAFRSRALNDAVAFACGLVLLLPPHYFRAFHSPITAGRRIRSKIPSSAVAVGPRAAPPSCSI